MQRASALEALDKELDEGDRLRLIDDVHQERADDGNDHERLPAHAVAVLDGGHVDDCGRGGAEAVAEKARAHNGSIVVLAKDTEDDKVAEQDEHDDLGNNDQQHRSDQVEQLIEVQAHQRDREVQVQHDVADAVDQREAEVVPVEFLVEVADDHGDEHRADVGREAHADEFADPAGDQAADRHADEDGRDVLDDVQRGQLLGRAGVYFLNGSVEVLAFVRGKVVFLDEQTGDRSADQHAEDQAKGGRSRTDRHAGGIAHLNEGRAVGACSAVAADHGDGAGEQCVGIFKAGNSGKPDADEVLDDGHRSGDQPVDHQQHAAFLQQLHRRAETDCREERDHERILQAGVEVEAERSGLMSGEGPHYDGYICCKPGGNGVIPDEP